MFKAMLQYTVEGKMEIPHLRKQVLYYFGKEIVDVSYDIETGLDESSEWASCEATLVK